MAKPEESMGVTEAAVEGVKAGVAGYRDGLGQLWDAAKPIFDHGRTEAAAALFHGSAGHVLYMQGQEGVEQGQGGPQHGLFDPPQYGIPVEPLHRPEPEQDRGMGM